MPSQTELLSYTGAVCLLGMEKAFNTANKVAKHTQKKYNFTVNLAFIFPSIPPQSGRNRPSIRLNVKGEDVPGTGDRFFRNNSCLYELSKVLKTLNGQFCV